MDLTIITVCYNASKDLQKTFDSILSQKYTDFEYLVIDGKSKDDTANVIQEYKRSFEEKDIDFKFQSEPDKGIYDAMNKGVRLATRKYVLFMNAGDLFYSDTTLGELNSLIQSNDSNILYGSTLYAGNGINRLREPMNLTNITKKMVFCHQSVMVNKDLLAKHPFNTSFRICADYETFVYFYLNKYSFRQLPLTIAIFQIGGNSKKYKLKYFKEIYAIHSMYGIEDSKFKLYCNLVNEYLRSLMRAVVPLNVLKLKNKILNKIAR